jgi:arylsulfatase A-like enzyme
MAHAREEIAMGPTNVLPLVRQVVGVMAAFATVTGAMVMTARAVEPATDAARRTASIRSLELGRAEGSTRPNIVLILTDDQRFDTLWAMPTVQRELVGRGVRFTNGYVSNPVCCPSRSTILTGQYSHTTGVYTNDPEQPYGGFPAFRDGSTVATWLHEAGYHTALMGKYLNGYGGAYVPPGWDRWFATYAGGFFDYIANDDGVVRTYGSGLTEYGTDVLADEAVSFIRSTGRDDPLFLYFAPHAPHEPATPAPSDADAFAGLTPWRPASFDEPDLSDKPAFLEAEPRFTQARIEEIDRFRRDQYRSLLAVDRAVGRIVDALRTTGRLSNTMIVFMSDNGMLWGEHRWTNKLVPYEESLRVPFVIRADFLIRSPASDPRFVLNVDLAPTFAALAGVEAPNVEGRSLLPLFGSRRIAWRSDFLIEHLRMDDRGVTTYCGVHSARYVYVAYVTGEEELYDLDVDPAQLQNVAGRRGYAGVLGRMRLRLQELCTPAPPGMSLDPIAA